MLNIERMNMVGNVFSAVTCGLTDEEIVRVIIITFPRAMRRAFEKHDEFVRKENEGKEKKGVDELGKANAAVSEIVDMAKKMMKEGMSRDKVEFIIRAALHHVELGLGEED